MKKHQLNLPEPHGFRLIGELQPEDLPHFKEGKIYNEKLQTYFVVDKEFCGHGKESHLVNIVNAFKVVPYDNRYRVYERDVLATEQFKKSKYR